MNITLNDRQLLAQIGINIEEGMLKIEDAILKHTYKFDLSEIGQLTIKRSYGILNKIFNSKLYHSTETYMVKISKWDLSDTVVLRQIYNPSLFKKILKRLNNYFYHHS